MDVEDFLTIARELEREGVEYVLVGALALGFQGLVRGTQDIDLFVRPERENVERLKQALRTVYADPCVEEINVDDLAGDYPVVRYGPPEGDYLVDLIGRLGEAWCFDDLEKEERNVNGVRVHLATPRTLYRMKRNTVRAQDKVDAEALREKFQLED